MDKLMQIRISNLLERIDDILFRRSRGNITDEGASKEGVEALIDYVGEDLSNMFSRADAEYQFELFAIFEDFYEGIGMKPVHKKDGVVLKYRGFVEDESGNFYLCAEEFSDLALRWIDLLQKPVNKKIKTQEEAKIVGALTHALIKLGSNRHQAEHFVSKLLKKSYPGVKKKYVEWKDQFVFISDDEFFITQMVYVTKFVERHKGDIPQSFPQAKTAYERIIALSNKAKSFNEAQFDEIFSDVDDEIDTSRA